MVQKVVEKQRKRAPSKRSLETRERILDAAEEVFAHHGFEGASIRDIAARAGVPGALVNHHGGAKDELFFTVVARRADTLAALRLEALDARRDVGGLSLHDILASFVLPFLDKVRHGGPGWLAYGRLIAHVSADERWRPISQACFDPTAQHFIDEISALMPGVARARIGACFVFMVSAMLSLVASRWRIDALAGDGEDAGTALALLAFCEAGFHAAASAEEMP